MSNQLSMIPIHLDGFFLQRETLVTEAFADFSRLPFSSSEGDYHPDTANISEAILSLPFQNQNLNLKRGMHLHWALPDALTQGGAGGTADDYPAVPNRWLITRRKYGALQKQWVVESDYLHAGRDNPYQSIAFPVDTQASATDQPYRYLGRQLEANGWMEDPQASRLSKLTAVGYGEPAYAAFYPNCHSVFGCFDEDIREERHLQGLSYQLIGWYSDPVQDPLASFAADLSGRVPDIAASVQEDHPNAEIDEIKALVNEAIVKSFKDQFSWDLAIEGTQLPVGMICYADLDFQPSADIENAKQGKPVALSIGNTGTEALSAYVANRLPSSDKVLLEEQLESLLLQSTLQSKTLDVGPRFREARHEKGFRAEKGGSLWEIKLANDASDQSGIQLTLPPEMGDTLSQLNLLQQQYDHHQEKIRQLKHFLFADWYKYMLCAYPPDDAWDDYPDIDLVKWYIEENGLPLIEQASRDLEASLAATSALQVDLAQQVETFNTSTIEKTVFFKPLDVKTADTLGLASSGFDWMENKPFSEHCLRMNGTDALISLAKLDDVKAISLWLNLATQNTPDACLLATKSAGVLIGKNGVADAPYVSG